MWGTGVVLEEARQIASNVCRLPSIEQSHDQEQVYDTFGYGIVRSIEQGQVLHQARLAIEILASARG